MTGKAWKTPRQVDAKKNLIVPASKRDREAYAEEPAAEPGQVLTRAQRRRADAALAKSKRNLNPPKQTTERERRVQDQSLEGLMEYVKEQQERLLAILDRVVDKMPADVRIESRRVMCAMSLAMWHGYLEAYVAGEEEKLDIVKTAREWRKMFVFPGALKPEERKSNIIVAPAGTSGLILP